MNWIMSKEIRLQRIEKDIEESLFFEEELKEIKTKYLSVKSEVEFLELVEEHDELVDVKEVALIKKWIKALKEIQINK